jgi:serine O-acetyltransferase
MERDPAATSAWSAYFNYPGLKAIRRHRVAHRLYLSGHTFLARALSQGERPSAKACSSITAWEW